MTEKAEVNGKSANALKERKVKRIEITNTMIDNVLDALMRYAGESQEKSKPLEIKIRWGQTIQTAGAKPGWAKRGCWPLKCRACKRATYPAHAEGYCIRCYDLAVRGVP